MTRNRARLGLRKRLGLTCNDSYRAIGGLVTAEVASER